MLAQQSSIAVILAGGISPDNVIEGISRVHPAGVDSCTGTNAVDLAGKPIRFKKDPVKVAKLVQAVRQLDRRSTANPD
jgi:phosphoribosylanthranilate isomerase